MPGRDPLSKRYDGAARRALFQAINAHKVSPRSPRRVRVWVSFPGPQLRRLDRGGLTANERAFKRAAYYQVWSVPVHEEDRPPDWSLKMELGRIERRGTRWGRWHRLTLYRYADGKRHIDEGHGRPHWRDDIAGLDARSTQGNRIDEERES